MLVWFTPYFLVLGVSFLEGVRDGLYSSPYPMSWLALKSMLSSSWNGLLLVAAFF